MRDMANSERKLKESTPWNYRGPVNLDQIGDSGGALER